MMQLLHDKLCDHCTCISKYCQICIKTGQELTKKDISFLVSDTPKMHQIILPAS